jgi:hypothetical protein
VAEWNGQAHRLSRALVALDQGVERPTGRFLIPR